MEDFVDALGGGGAIDAMMPMPAAAMTGGTGTATGFSSTTLKTVDRVRNVFPETWLWTNTSTGYISFLVLK